MWILPYTFLIHIFILIFDIFRPAFFPSEREFLHPDEVQEQDRIKEILENM